MLKLSGTDWISVINEWCYHQNSLDPPSSLKTYTGWTRKFQNCTRSKILICFVFEPTII